MSEVKTIHIAVNRDRTYCSEDDNCDDPEYWNTIEPDEIGYGSRTDLCLDCILACELEFDNKHRRSTKVLGMIETTLDQKEYEKLLQEGKREEGEDEKKQGTLL